MSFEWMETGASPQSGDQAKELRRAMHASEVRERAGLLQRLGYEQGYALHRCLGNLVWGFELKGRPPLSVAEVRNLVAEVYGG